MKPQNVYKKKLPLSMIDLTIDLDALRHNFRHLRAFCGTDTKILAAVKANAYGHGLLPVSRALIAEGVDYLGVGNVAEGLALRQAGINTPILLILGLRPSEASLAVAYDLEPVLYRLDVAEALAAQARQQGKKVQAHLKIDTGMGRIGLQPQEVWPFLDKLATLPELALKGLISHFAVADSEDKAYTIKQLAQFEALLQGLRGRGWQLPLNHIANSAALLEGRNAHLDMVRAGIMLYGSPPARNIPSPVPLRPVMALRTEILQLKWLPPDHSISYGCTYTTSAPCRLAVLPVGYCNGYNRLLSNRGEVLIQGRRAPIRGRVCMNLTMVEVTHIPDLCEGEIVTLLGQDREAVIRADELADWAQTISYEIHCLLGNSNPQRFLGE
jgi:alanine racemase